MRVGIKRGGKGRERKGCLCIAIAILIPICHVLPIVSFSRSVVRGWSFELELVLVLVLVLLIMRGGGTLCFLCSLIRGDLT